LLGVILQGCTNIPKQKFIEEANDLSNKDKVPIYFTQSEQSDINMKYEQYYRKLLRNNNIMGAAYDEAVIENKAQSIESILNTNWHYKLLKRGIIHLDDNEKMIVITILTNKLLSATYLECAAINSELGNVFHLLDIDQTNKIIQIQYKAVLAGTVKPNLNIIDANKDAYVALTGC
jgi:putative ribosome biogenesis GTPase RsgA